MLVIGLTGGIATGKSSVSDLLKAKNIPVVDADILARQVVEPGTPALARIVEFFGQDILFSDGTLDRKKLGSIVFNDEQKRRKLNSIVHPAVQRAMAWSVLKHWFCGEKYCIVDVPLLIEGGLWKWMGKVIVVYCSPEIQLQRLMMRDNSSKEDASSRLNAQLPISDKVKYADVVIDNSGSRQDLEQNVSTLVDKLNEEVGWSWIVSWVVPFAGLFSAVTLLGWRWMKRRSRKKVKEN